jgi:uncharacterized protein (DUF305 family)
MVDIKTSAQRAVEFLNMIYPHHGDGIQVEEVDTSDDERYWLITLGYNVPESQNPLALAMGSKRREYKTFKVDRETGEVKSMKIRKV